MYFNRKNAEQKNWRMIKKGKHFLFGCSLVFAVGAALVAPSVKADTVEAKPDTSSTTEGAKPVVSEENPTYAAPAVEVAPAAVAEEKAEKPVETTQNSKEEAVVATEKAKEADSIKAPEVTVVYDPAALTEEEKAKVVEAVKAANPTATDVQVQADGSVVVTFADGSSANLTAAQTIKDGSQVAKPRKARAASATATRASEGAQNLDYSNKPNPEGFVKATYEVDNAKNTIHWTVVVNGGRVGNQTSGYSYFTVPKDSVGAPTNWRVLQTDKNGNTMSDRRYWKDNDGTYPMGGAGKMNVYTGSKMTKELTDLYKKIGNPAIKGNEAAAAQQASERSQALYMLTADVAGGIFKNPSWTITFDTPILDKSKPLDYTAGLQGTAGVGGKTNIMAGYADNFIDNASSKFQAVAVKEKYTAKVGGSFDADPATYVTNKAGTPEFPNNYRGATTFAWKDGQAPTATQAGTYTKTVVVTYPAHYNQAPQEVTVTFEVEGETPKPVTPAAQAPEITSNLDGKASTPADVTVKATAGSTVKLYNKDGVVIGEAVANDQGVATITPTNSLPEGEITATSTPVGGSESAKSEPITVTKTPITESGVNRNGDAYTQLLLSKTHITVYPGDNVDIDVIGAASSYIKRFYPVNPNSVYGLFPDGTYFQTTGSQQHKQLKNKYHGTVHEMQPAGDFVTTFVLESKNGKVVSTPLKITVLESAKKYEPVAGEKVEVADPNKLSEDDKNKIIDSVKTANPSLPASATYGVDEKGNLTITYPDKSIDKIAAAYLVTPAKDTTAPDKPVVNTDLTGKAGTKTPVEVTAEKGSTVALYDKDNNKIGEATAGENGKATITPTVAIPAGNVTAKATDAAGNTSVASDPKVATSATPARENVAPTVEIPYSDPAPNKKEVYLYTGEEADVDITFNDDSGKIKSAALKQGGNKPLSAVNGNPDKQDNQFGYTVTAINSETATPAKIKVTGQVSGIAAEKLPKTEDDSLDLVTRYATATDTDGAEISNNAVKNKNNAGEIVGTYLTDPGAVTFVLKAQTKKYDIKTPASADKVTVSDANNVTDKEFEKIKEKVKVEYSQNNPDARLADKKGKEVEDASKVVDKVEKEGNKVVVTYKDGSKDTKPLSEFVNVAPTVELPYSNKTKKEIYVYTGENTDLTFKASDNTAVKDMYVRGPGGIGKDNTADYGFTTGKIENSAVTHGDGTVSGPTATIKMTGVTTLKAPNHWTSFVVANDNDNAPSNTDFNALDKNPNATQTPGYVHFIVKSQTDKYDIATPAPADKVEVADPTNVTNDDLAKIKEKLKLEYNKKNDDANIAKDTPVDKNGKIQSVTKDDKGNLVVTYKDGSKDTKPLSEFVTKKPTTPAKDADGVKDPAKTPVKDPANLTDAEKAKVADEVKKANPTAKDVEVGKDGTTTVTFPDGSKAEIPAAKTVEKAKDATPAKDADGVKDPAKTPVKDPANLTDEEKAKVADEVKKANPTAKDVEVGKDGTATVTFPDGSKAELPTAKTVEKAKDATPAKDADGVKDPAKTPVKDPANLTDEEKAKVADEVKKANPTAKDVEVGKDGTATVTFPDGSKAELPTAKTVEKAKDATPAKDADGVKDPAKTPVKDPANLTDAEKAKVADEVKKANPTAKDVEVGKDGTATVTFPDGSKAELPAAKTVEKAKDATPAKDADGVKDPAKTPVKDPANLTDAEKAKVADEVKKANPTAKDVEVGKDGTATVTFPDGSKAELPTAKTVEKAKDATPAKDADGVKDPAKTPVKDPANLTDEEKAKVADEVKKANPTAKDVEVGKDGTATVTFPDGSKAELPTAKTVEKAKDATPAKDADGVKDPAKTPVKDPANLTDEEKAKVADEVKKANPTAKDVEVGKDGTTTVTFPDGSKAELPAAKTVEKAKDATPAKDADGVKDPAKTPVKDPANLTDEEKAKVADEVKKANPTAKDVEVGKDGTTTVTFPDGSKAELPAAKTVEKAKDATPAKDADGVKDPAKTPVKDPANLTDAEKAKVADEVKKANPTAKDVEVGKDGTTTVTFPDGSKAELPAAKTVEKAKDATPAKDADGVKDPAKTPVKDPANLTDEEKAKVADEVKKANPTAKDVEVGKDGTTTVTFPDGSKAEIPAAKTVEKAKDATPAKDADGVKDPAKTPVKDPANLTDAEKAKVADEVKKANPTAKDVEVGKDGTTTVTFPDGSKAEIPAAKTVEKAKDATPAKDADGIKDPAKTPVKDPANLTDDEKAKVADEVKKANPTAKDVEVGKDGTTTVTFPDGTTAVIPADKTVKKSDDKVVKDPSVTPVTDPSNLTDAEKAKVAEEVKKANPTAKDVEVGKDGTTTVTFPDGTTAVIPADKTVKKSDDKAVKDPSVTPVTDPSNLTDAEKAKVAEEVKKANPTAKDVEVGKDGTTTVTFPDGTTAVIPADKTVKKSDDKAVKDPSVTPVTDPSNLTDAEKAKVAEEVKKANPTAKDVEVGKDGTTTVTFPDGTTAVIPADKTVKKSDDKAVKDPSVTPVTDPSNLTDAEKAKVAEEVKKANPTAKDVEVGKDGTTTVTFPDGTTAVIPADKTVKKSDDKVVKDPSVTPVTDPSNLTDAEKAKVAEEVKKANPTAKDVEVGKDGTTTVTFPDGTTAVIPADKTVKKSDDKVVKDPSVTPVTDPSNLTDAEKGKVAEEVKKANPTAKDVEVGKDGTTTVTFPDGTTAVIPADKTVKKSDDKGTKDPAVTPVTDPSNLTDAEKAKVAEEVKKANPTAKDVEVGKDGTTTVTFPDGTTAVIPADKTVKKSDDKVVKDPSVTPVTDPSNLTDAEKAKVAEEVKKANPTAKDVEVGKDGTTTVTFPDGTTAVIPADKTVKKSDDKVVKDPSVTPVTEPSNLTDAEKAKVAEEVKKANPTAKDVEVGKDGTTTVTFPDGTTAVIPADKTVKKSDDKAVKDPSVTPVTDPSNLTDAEKAKVAEEVKKANPTAKDVEVGKDGTTTVTYPDGTTAVIPADKTVKKSDDKVVTDPAVTPVTDPSNLTDAEKGKVAEEVKKANPTVTDVKVDKDGTTTVTYPDGTTAVIPADKTVKKSDDKVVTDPAVTPVTDPSNLTDAEKAKVTDEVKKSNPTVSKVEVGNDGTTTVTYPDGTTAVIPADKTVKKSSDKTVKDPSVTPVTDPSNLTDAEKGKVAEEVKKANPTVTDVKVEKDGTTTVTYPDGTTAVIPSDKTVKKSADKVVTNPTVTPVVDPSNLTDAEKAKVAEEVKKANPTASKVEVGNDGTATVTFPDGSVAVLTPEKTVKEADSNGVKNPAITPVVNPSALTDAEKAKVADEVKKANPTASKVEVGNDGTATVTYPDGSVAVLTPAKTVKEADSNGVKTPAITPVVSPSSLTDAEKAKVADEVKKANPTASKVEVGNDGTATVTYPDGSVAVLTPTKTVKSADSNGVKNPLVTPVTDPSNLTDAEKAKVADEVKKANPTASKVEVGNDGTATVTFPDGSVAVLTPEKTVKEADSNGVKTPAITPVVNPSALTDAEKAKVADEVKKANPTASKVEVGNDGTATVTFPDGSVAVLTPEKTVKEATKESSANPASKKAGAKELPNTGTEQSNASVGLALLAAATGGLLFAKKRKEEE